MENVGADAAEPALSIRDSDGEMENAGGMLGNQRFPSVGTRRNVRWARARGGLEVCGHVGLARDQAAQPVARLDEDLVGVAVGVLDDAAVGARIGAEEDDPRAEAANAEQR